MKMRKDIMSQDRLPSTMVHDTIPSPPPIDSITPPLDTIRDNEKPIDTTTPQLNSTAALSTLLLPLD